ncbi:MAG TPA: tRNA lysidine(34) synthetase TilS [Thermoanaerobaculia bacterium]|jgi:tRNA(Ile)-lysidine synthase
MSSPPVERELERTFRPLIASGRAPLRVLVAFSGGPDSIALLAGLAAVAPRLGLEVHAAHLDHGLDGDSARRAREAVRLAAGLGIALAVAGPEPNARPGGQSVEAAARRARYAFLERRADEVGADFVATAHHADDQAETVLLRLLFGSGLAGLAGIRERRGRLVRPLLGLRRRQLHDGLGSLLAPLSPVVDPTNDDLAVARNRVRHLLLPRLERRWPDVVERLCALAAAAAAAGRRTDALLAARLAPRPLSGEPGVEVDRAAFDALPEALVPHALALLHRRAGAAFPAAAQARGELGRQLRAGPGGRAGCDCGGGWRWEAGSGVLQLARREPFRPEFTYTLEVPGEVEIPEIGLRFRLCRGRVAPWMFTARPDRAGLAEPRPAAGGGRCRIEVRNRRPGDRFTPLGCGHRRRLKDLLIDRRVPRRRRDRLPLLVVDGEIAWVPGVTVAERFRLASPSSGRWAWIAEIETLEGRGIGPSGNGGRDRYVPHCEGSAAPDDATTTASPAGLATEQERLEP